MSEKHNLESLLEKLPNLTDDELKWDYLNKVEFTQPLGNLICSLEDFDLALRIVKLAFDIDLKLGAFLAGKLRKNGKKKLLV